MYLVDNGLIRIHKQEIIDECRSGQLLWSNWQVQFIKNYQYKETAAVNTASGDKVAFDYSSLRVLLDSDPAAADLLKLVGAQNSQLKKFLQEVLQLTMLCQNSAAALEGKITKLPADSMVRVVVESAKPANCSLSNFLEKRLRALHSPDRVIIDLH